MKWLPILIFIFTGCSLLDENRTFTQQMERDSDDMFVAGNDYPVVAGDKGSVSRSKEEIIERTPPTSGREQRERWQKEALEEELRSLEDGLPNKEYQHYLSVADKLPNISEKIFFLRLKGVRERNEYLYGRGVIASGKRLGAQEEVAINNREILLGMSKSAVLESWGRPARVDVAGDPNYENERWLFYTYEGAQYVFFERGRVKGWMAKGD